MTMKTQMRKQENRLDVFLSHQQFAWQLMLAYHVAGHAVVAKHLRSDVAEAAAQCRSLRSDMDDVARALPVLLESFGAVGDLDAAVQCVGGPAASALLEWQLEGHHLDDVRTLLDEGRPYESLHDEDNDTSFADYATAAFLRSPDDLSFVREQVMSEEDVTSVFSLALKVLLEDWSEVKATADRLLGSEPRLQCRDIEVALAELRENTP